MDGQLVSDIYRSWIDSVNRQELHMASEMLPATVIYNGNTVSREEYIKGFEDQMPNPDRQIIDVDILLVDDHGRQLAARLIHRAASGPMNAESSHRSEKTDWAEHIICSFSSDKIEELASISDVELLQDSNGSNAILSTQNDPESRDDGQLQAMYRDYIDAINSGATKQRLSKYCQPHVTHNSRHMSIEEYQQMIEPSFEAIQGLHFTIEELVVDAKSQQLGVRIGFTGRPVQEFMGIQPTGKDVVFSEHALYKLAAGKIVRVWSLLDLTAYRNSIAALG